MATILIVDDRPANREFLVTLLGYRNHRLLEANDGAEALVMTRVERPDLIITDVLMPTMDGYEFVRRLRADPEITATPVIFYTASYRKQEAESLAKSCGVSHILVKPCEPELILATVDQLLESPAQTVAPRVPQDFSAQHVRVITDKLSQTADQLHATNAKLGAFIEIGLQLASERNPPQLLNNVCRVARALLGAGYAVLAVGSRNVGNDVMAVTSGMNIATAVSLSRPDLRNGELGAVFSQRKTIRMSGIRGGAEAVGLPPDYPPVHSLLAAPIMSLEHVYGWICLTNKVGADEFSQDDERLLGILAAQVGRIYENGSLYLEIQKHAERLEAEIVERKLAQGKVERLNRVHAVLSGINTLIVRVRDRQELFDEACRIAVELGGFGMAWIGSLNPETQAITPVAYNGDDVESFLMYRSTTERPDSPLGQSEFDGLVREKRVVFNNDLATDPTTAGGRRREAMRRGYRSGISLPLLVDGNVVGNLTLFAKEVNFFTADELKLLEELAGDISFALDHIGKEEKLGKMSRIRAVSSEINAAIVRIREREALLQETCRITAEHGKFELVWIALLDPATQTVRPIAWTGFTPDAAHSVTWSSIRSSKGTLGTAIETRKAAVVNDIGTGLQIGRLRQEAVNKGCYSTVCLPLVVNDSVVALIALFAPGQDFFDAGELALLNELAADVSFALNSIAQQEEINYLAYYDALTGLPNRVLFHDRLSQEIQGAKRAGGKVAVLMLCIKRFRHVNETLGRQAGDAVLVELAQRLKRMWRESDHVARIGGDGFAGVFSHVKEASELAHMFERALADSFDLPFIVDDNELIISVVAGIAVFPADGDDADALLRNAEAALKKAKLAGERYLFYEPRMNATVAATLMLENKLRRALEKEQFVLHYQPKSNFSTGRIVGLEALIRWNDPETGLVPPAHFIPLLEETGLILEAGRWAIRQALADYREWGSRGLKPPRVAVNLSPIQLRQKDFVEMVRDTIADSKVVPHGLDLEITESLIMEDIEGNTRKLKALRDMGVNIAIDDFGTGYSSLAYLARLPVNALKIDRSFIISMADNPDSMTIVSMIISLAHSLKLIVVAEGVETAEQSKFLKLLSCDEMQGYLLSKPLPAGQIVNLIGK